MEDREQKVREIFNEAAELPPAEWAGFLERRTEDLVVRARVKTLLDHHVKAGDFLARPAMETFPDVAGAMGGQIAEFRIVREIGRGGMGVVYLAEDTILKRAVALKVLPPQFDAEARAGDRFRKEAQAVARLSHPRIVKVFRYGEERSYSYIAMEYVEGDTLRGKFLAGSDGALSRTNDADTQTYARLVAEVADALDHAHQQGVIHRDIKPSNILIDQGNHARLTDFGVAKIVTEETLSKGTDITGSYPYMSPEQARVQSIEIDHRSDIFSLGVVLYELLTHVRPFDGASPQEIIRALSDGRPTGIRKIVPRIPVDLAIICHKAIEKSPEDRYQTAAHMAADLRCFLSGRPILARAPGLRRRARVWGQDHKVGLTITAGVVLIGVAGGLAMMLNTKRLAGQGTVSIRVIDAPAESRVFASRLDAATARFGKEIGLGKSPVTERHLEPGIYRFVVRGPSGMWAEFQDAVLPATLLRREAISLQKASDTSNMVRFEGGAMKAQFDEPSNGSHRDETPLLAPFWIDDVEVTNGDYLGYTKVTGAVAPEYWARQKWEEIRDLPVVALSRDEMQNYALWAGKRLATVYEWLGAAQAPDGRLVPWGGEVPAGMDAPPKGLRAAKTLDVASLESDYRTFTQRVRSGPELRTAAGLFHMYGNVREMTATVVLQDHQVIAICAGGDWTARPESFKLSTITQYPYSSRSTQIGFRCARSVSMPAGGE